MPQLSRSTTVPNKGQYEIKDLTFYPAYCYSVSPTWFVWVKLTGYDIHHHLKPQPAGTGGQSSHHAKNGFGGGNNNTFKDAPLVLFYQNHPIQFVQICGVIVAYEDYHPTLYLFTIDDSSGATIDVVCRKPKPDPALSSTTVQNQHKPTTTTITTNSSSTTNKTKTGETDHDEEDESHPSATLLAQLSTLSIGTVVIAKGTLSTFRSVPQLTLLRLFSPQTTTQELSYISSRTTFLTTVLSEPWTVGKDVQEKLLLKAKGEVEEDGSRARRAKERERRREKRERRHAEEVRSVYEETEEVGRRDGAERAMRDGVDVMLRMKRRREEDEEAAG